jgi:hypothetical protein
LDSDFLRNERVLLGPLRLQSELAAGGVDVVPFFATQSGHDAVPAEDRKKAFLFFS